MQCASNAPRVFTADVVHCGPSVPRPSISPAPAHPPSQDTQCTYIPRPRTLNARTFNVRAYMQCTYRWGRGVTRGHRRGTQTSTDEDRQCEGTQTRTGNARVGCDLPMGNLRRSYSDLSTCRFAAKLTCVPVSISCSHGLTRRDVRIQIQGLVEFATLHWMDRGRA